MIEQAPGSPSIETVSVLVLPHRSLSRPGLVLYLIAQSIATIGFALLAAWRGIVLAPVFAVSVLALLAYCLNRVWRASGNGETITLMPSRLEIVAAGAGTAHFHPYWVRVRLLPGRRRGWPSRLLLGSHGRDVEVGAFLNEAERRVLAQRLTDLLRPLQARDGSSGISKQGDNE
ncbi:MAG: DUF2244 domain-containing protein [Rudaea sp.]|nr:DUF2244 domain-containing protein [Rudaea sp.]